MTRIVKKADEGALQIVEDENNPQDVGKYIICPYNNNRGCTTCCAMYEDGRIFKDSHDKFATCSRQLVPIPGGIRPVIIAKIYQSRITAPKKIMKKVGK